MKRLLSIMLALMLVLSMAATAFATETGTEQTKAGETKVDTIAVSKTYNDPVGYGAKFYFTATPKVDGTTSLAGVPTVTIPAIEFVADTTTTTRTKTSTLVFENLKEGTYVYIVTENDTFDPTTGIAPDPSTYDRMIMSLAEYEMTVSVVKNAEGKYVVDNIIAYQTKDAQGNPMAKGDKADVLAFENTYVKQAGVKGEALTITKRVEKVSNFDQEFTFTLQYTYPAGGNPFPVATSHSGNGDVTVNDGANGGIATFKLKHNQDVVFKGLPIGTTVTVIETGSPSFNPKGQVVLNGTTTDIAAAGYGNNFTSGQQVLPEGKNVVTVTNTGNYTPPMGVILNVLPYVLMVAIAGGMIVLFTVMKRRKAQDNED